MVWGVPAWIFQIPRDGAEICRPAVHSHQIRRVQGKFGERGRRVDGDGSNVLEEVDVRLACDVSYRGTTNVSERFCQVDRWRRWREGERRLNSFIREVGVSSGPARVESGVPVSQEMRETSTAPICPCATPQRPPKSTEATTAARPIMIVHSGLGVCCRAAGGVLVCRRSPR